MSDFLNDDFTEELKIYFVDSVKTRLQNFLEIYENKDQSFLQILKDELSAWAIDAETNELIFFGKWLRSSIEKESFFDSEKSLRKYLEVTSEYAARLGLNIKSDEIIYKDLNERFAETLEEQYLVFEIQESLYALPLKVIREITSFKKLNALIDKTEKVLGYMSFRGEALPVMDLSFAGISSSMQACQVGIICSIKDNQFVICAKNTKELLSVSESQLRKISNFDSDESSTFVSSVLLYEENNVLILDVEKMVAA